MLPRRTSAILLGSALLVSLGVSGTAFAGWQADLDEAKATAAAESKPLLIDFYTDW